MPLGYCTECDQLKAITPLGLKYGSRECEWAPIEHARPDTHRGCGGRIEDVDGLEEFARAHGEDFWCPRCERGVIVEDIRAGTPHCDGSRKPIR